jgi:hypothetical protein
MVSGALDGGKWAACLRTLRKKGILSESDSSSPSDHLELTTLGRERVALLKVYTTIPVVAEERPPPVPCPQPISPQLPMTLDLTQDSEEAEAVVEIEEAEMMACFDLSCPNDDEFEWEGGLSSSQLDDPPPPLGLRERLLASSAEGPQARERINIAAACCKDSLVTKRKFVEERRRPSPVEGQENDPLTLSQPTTDREKRRVNALRALPSCPSAATQTFSLCRSHSTGLSTTAPPMLLREETALSLGSTTLEEWEVVLLIDRREKDHAFFESFFTERGVRNEVSCCFAYSLLSSLWCRSVNWRWATTSGWPRGRSRLSHLQTFLRRRMERSVTAVTPLSLVWSVSHKEEKGEAAPRGPGQRCGRERPSIRRRSTAASWC